MRATVLTVMCLFVAAAARAQSPYVAGTIGADVSRFGHTDSTFSSTPCVGSTPSGISAGSSA